MSEILDIAAALSRLLKAENVLLICHKTRTATPSAAPPRWYWALKGLGKNSGRAVRGPHPVPV